ncbi:MAG TPA: DUF2752 domain-containing protein [Verrucomicrobiales bacterium]|jgi:hypothetical protein|nr:DUF2752 domain-containing protein [Verrucomicrobiales bacterium]
MKHPIPMAAALVVLGWVSFALVFGVPCRVREAWGVRCPFCGVQKACAALSQGDVSMAFYWNAPLLPVCLLLLYCLARPPRSWRWLAALITGALAFGLVRNLPFYPLY